MPDGLWELSVGVAPQGVLPRSKGVGLLQPTQSLATTTPAGGRAHIAFQVSLAEAGPKQPAAVYPLSRRGPCWFSKGWGWGRHVVASALRGHPQMSAWALRLAASGSGELWRARPNQLSLVMFGGGQGGHGIGGRTVALST